LISTWTGPPAFATTQSRKKAVAARKRGRRVN
jgi:hypothetical protein